MKSKRLFTSQNLNINVEFKPQDLWVGIYWRWRGVGMFPWWAWLDVWVCIVPMFPLHFLACIRVPNWMQKRRSSTS